VAELAIRTIGAPLRPPFSSSEDSMLSL